MKKKELLLIPFIFIVIFSIVMVKDLTNLDELWNYNTARVIADGLTPYKDISMITTPLLPMLTAICLKIFGNEIIVSRILTAILWTGIFFTIYKILFKLVKEENISLIITAILGLLCRDIFCIDYNVLSLFLVLIILYQELKNIDKKEIIEVNKKYNLLIGILAGLVICTKQSVGATTAIITVLYPLFFVKNKDQFIKFIKNACFRILGILIPILIIFIYLVINGALSDFINYAVLGISTFKNKIPYRNLFNKGWDIKILAGLMPVSILIMAIAILSDLKKQEKSNILTILLYTFSIILVMYPISDNIHFLLGSLIPLLGFAYILIVLIKAGAEKIKWNKKYKVYKIISSMIWIIIFGFLLFVSFKNIYKYMHTEKSEKLLHYKNIGMNEKYENHIDSFSRFIIEQKEEGKKVIIVDAEAVLYSIPSNRYIKDYDMFLKGNIGIDGEDGQIEKIKNSDENNLFLIRENREKLNWQTPTKVIDYIINNLENIGNIKGFEIYVNRK